MVLNQGQRSKVKVICLFLGQMLWADVCSSYHLSKVHSIYFEFSGDHGVNRPKAGSDRVTPSAGRVFAWITSSILFHNCSSKLFSVRGVAISRKGQNLERDLDLWPCDQNEGQRSRGPMPKFQVIISYHCWVLLV